MAAYMICNICMYMLYPINSIYIVFLFFIYTYGGIYFVSVNTNMKNRNTGLTFSCPLLAVQLGPRGGHEGPAHRGPAQ